MPDQPKLPGPTEHDLLVPLEWITTEGEIKWVSYSGKEPCEDCKHVILDHLNRKQQFDRAPGLSRRAGYKRVQGGEFHLICSGHRQIRLVKEQRNDQPEPGRDDY